MPFVSIPRQFTSSINPIYNLNIITSYKDAE